MDFFRVKSTDEMSELIDAHVQRLSNAESVSPDHASGRILYEDIHATEDVPGFSRSTVDGYAVKAVDTHGATEAMPAFLSLAGSIDMGQEASIILGIDQAVYVPTGAMIPEGADAVVMIEDADLSGDLVQVFKPVRHQENVILKGEDTQKGSAVLTAGTEIRPQEAGALAALGIKKVAVCKKPVIGYLSSGDEIVPYDKQELKMGEIRDVNGVTIPSLIRSWGCDVIVSPIATDDRRDFQEKASRLFEQCDMVIMSGGSSVGEKDYTTEVIESLGDGTPGLLVHGVSVKPGKPTILSVTSNKPVLGLPGHPASAMVIFHMFGRQIIHQLLGVNSENRHTTVARVSQNIPSSPGRTDYIRVTLKSGTPYPEAEPVLGKSGLISTLIRSDGLMEIPSRKEGVQKGDLVKVHYFI